MNSNQSKRYKSLCKSCAFTGYRPISVNIKRQEHCSVDVDIQREREQGAPKIEWFEKYQCTDERLD